MGWDPVNEVIVREGELFQLGEASDLGRQKARETLGFENQTGNSENGGVVGESPLAGYPGGVAWVVVGGGTLTVEAQVFLDEEKSFMIGGVKMEGGVGEKKEREKS